MNGSPRRAGNTAALAAEFTRGAQEAGNTVVHETGDHYLYICDVEQVWQRGRRSAFCVEWIFPGAPGKVREADGTDDKMLPLRTGEAAAEGYITTHPKLLDLVSGRF